MPVDLKADSLTNTCDAAPSEESGDSHTHVQQPALSADSEYSHTTKSETPISLPNGRGWELQVGSATLRVERPHFDRSAVRAALTVSEGAIDRYHNVVNLTSEISRKKIVQVLQTLCINVDEGTLLKLEGLCRRSPSAEPFVCESPPFSETNPVRLAELSAVFKKRLLLADDDYLPIFVGAVLAHRLNSDPVWLLIVAPPGGTKSELLRSLYDYKGFYALSQLTARTLASGFGNRTDASLLSRLKGEILVLKDFTTVLQISHDERQAILAQLREVYDGRFDATWGTGQELHWEGRLGFIAGVTPVIDNYQSTMSLLGERFILFRPRMAERSALSRWSLQHGGSERATRRELRGAMHCFLKTSGSTAPTLPDALLSKLAAIGDLVTRGRSPVHRDYNRQFDYTPEPEAPTRFPKVLLSLAQGIAIAHDRPEVTEHELRLVTRVALDCLPPIRRCIVVALAAKQDASIDELLESASHRCSVATIRRAVEDLEALGVVHRVADSSSTEQRFALPAEWAQALQSQLPTETVQREIANDGGQSPVARDVPIDIIELLRAGEAELEQAELKRDDGA